MTNAELQATFNILQHCAQFVEKRLQGHHSVQFGWRRSLLGMSQMTVSIRVDGTREHYSILVDRHTLPKLETMLAEACASLMESANV